jgi:hypothetical protein
VKVNGGISVPANSAINKQIQRIAYASIKIIAQNEYLFIMQAAPREWGGILQAVTRCDECKSSRGKRCIVR